MDKLIERLEQFENTSECFYEVRSWGRSCEAYDALTDINKIFEDELRAFKSRD